MKLTPNCAEISPYCARRPLYFRGDTSHWVGCSTSYVSMFAKAGKSHEVNSNLHLTTFLVPLVVHKMVIYSQKMVFTFPWMIII